MTGGVAVILGDIGANFGAGMTGGMAYLYDPNGVTGELMNMETLVAGPVEVAHWHNQLRGLIERHVAESGSVKAADILQNWDTELKNFVQVCPKEMLDKLPHPVSLDQGGSPVGQSAG
jgi:glutamate synthase (NADPH/NADH) large chain